MDKQEEKKLGEVLFQASRLALTYFVAVSLEGDWWGVAFCFFFLRKNVFRVRVKIASTMGASGAMAPRNHDIIGIISICLEHTFRQFQTIRILSSSDLVFFCGVM